MSIVYNISFYFSNIKWSHSVGAVGCPALQQEDQWFEPKR